LPHRLEKLHDPSKALVTKLNEVRSGVSRSKDRGKLYLGYDGPLPPDFPAHLTKHYKSNGSPGKNVFCSESHSPKMLNAVKEIVLAKKEKPWGRALAHVGRLTEKGRTRTEQRFGLDFLKYVNLVKESLIVKDVLNSKVPATNIWWTLSPYLHKTFLGKGISPEQSIRMLVDWAGSAKGEFSDIQLPGISPDLADGLGTLEHPWQPHHERIGHQVAKEFAHKFADHFIEVFARKKTTKPSRSWKTHEQVKRLKVSDNRIGGGGRGTIFLGRVWFEKKGALKPNRVAVKRFHRGYGIDTPKRREAYETAIKKLRNAGLPLPKVGFYEHEGEVVQVMQLFGSTGKGSKLEADLRKSFEQRDFQQQFFDAFAKIANIGYPVATDAFGSLETPKGPKLIVMDFDWFADFEEGKPNTSYLPDYVNCFRRWVKDLVTTEPKLEKEYVLSELKKRLTHKDAKAMLRTMEIELAYV